MLCASHRTAARRCFAKTRACRGRWRRALTPMQTSVSEVTVSGDGSGEDSSSLLPPDGEPSQFPFPSSTGVAPVSLHDMQAVRPSLFRAHMSYGKQSDDILHSKLVALRHRQVESSIAHAAKLTFRQIRGERHSSDEEHDSPLAPPDGRGNGLGDRLPPVPPAAGHGLDDGLANVPPPAVAELGVGLVPSPAFPDVLLSQFRLPSSTGVTPECVEASLHEAQATVPSPSSMHLSYRRQSDDALH